jgi:hypothetical protein
MSHGFDGLSNEECFDEMAIEFIKTSGKTKLNTNCVAKMKPSEYKIK